MCNILMLTLKKLKIPPIKLRTNDEKTILAWLEVCKDECKFILLPLGDENKNLEIKKVNLLRPDINEINELDNKILIHNFSTLSLYFSNHSQLIAYKLYYDQILQFSSISQIIKLFLEKVKECKEIKNSIVLALFHENLLIGLKRLLQNILDIRIENVKYITKESFEEREIIISMKWKVVGKNEYIKEELKFDEKIFELIESIIKKGNNDYYEEDGHIIKILLGKNSENYSVNEKAFLVFYLLLDSLERQKLKWHINCMKKVYLKYKSIEFIILQRQLIREM